MVPFQLEWFVCLSVTVMLHSQCIFLDVEQFETIESGKFESTVRAQESKEENE